MEILTLLFAIVFLSIVISASLRHMERIAVPIPMKRTHMGHYRRQYD